LVVLAGREAEGLAVAAGEIAVAADELRDTRRAHPQLARIEDRVDALRPQAVVRAVPAEPVVVAHVDDAGRVAIDFLEAHGARQAVAPVALGQVAMRAGDLAVHGESPLEEQALAEVDRAAVSRDAVARIVRPGRRPRTVRLDFSRFLVGDGRRERRRAQKEKEEKGALHSSRMVCAARSTESLARSSNTSSHFPAMCIIRPSAL